MLSELVLCWWAWLECEYDWGRSSTETNRGAYVINGSLYIHFDEWQHRRLSPCAKKVYRKGQSEIYCRRVSKRLIYEVSDRTNLLILLRFLDELTETRNYREVYWSSVLKKSRKSALVQGYFISTQTWIIWISAYSSSCEAKRRKTTETCGL